MHASLSIARPIGCGAITVALTLRSPLDVRNVASL
jgi:hypothetical protein